MAAVERPRLWQLGMGGGVNSLQFYGRFGAGKRRCGVVEDSAMETATSLRGPGNSRRLLWLHDRVRSSFAWRVAAAALANHWNFQPTLLALRFVVSFVILLVPTTAMGLTLPVLIEDPVLRRSDFGRAIGFLYGSNALGAVAGALLGEAYLVGAFGLRGTSVAAGLASCVAAAMALVVTKLTATSPR